MITIMFSCSGCGLEDHKLQVPARESPEIDVRVWVDQLRVWVAEEHIRVSPHCKSKEIENLKIPIKDAEFIGQQVE